MDAICGNFPPFNLCDENLARCFKTNVWNEYELYNSCDKFQIEHPITKFASKQGKTIWKTWEQGKEV